MYNPAPTPLPEDNQPLPGPRPAFFIPLAKPLVTQVFLGALLVVFVVEIIYGIRQYGMWMTFTGGDIRVLVDLGAKVNPFIAAGAYWRLFTATLLHDGILHLAFNLYALFALGPLLEGYVGHYRFAAIYLLAGLYGSLLSYAFSSSISVGASGAVFGLLGGITVYFLRYHANFGAQGKAVLQNMVTVLIINFIFGLSVGYIDNWGHLGGLLGGALVTYGLLPRYRPPAVVRLGSQPLEVVPRRSAEIAWVVGCTVLWLAGVYWATVSGFAPMGIG